LDCKGEVFWWKIRKTVTLAMPSKQPAKAGKKSVSKSVAKPKAVKATPKVATPEVSAPLLPISPFMFVCLILAFCVIYGLSTGFDEGKKRAAAVTPTPTATATATPAS
jgi:hypothetical protein